MKWKKKLSGSRRSLRRPNPTRKPKPTVLIVCEGSKTEPTYFTDMMRDLKLALDIFGKECGSDPKSVVEYAKQKAQSYEYDHTWCVYDCDEHERLEEAHQQARDNGFSVAFSNPCFECWYLLHFESQTAHIERTQMVTRLKMHISDYRKARLKMYENLLERQPDAVRRARALRKLHGDNANASDSNPSTTVDCLVRHLIDLSNP